MTFKEFTAWCNERACDGRWDMLTAMVCIDLMAEIQKIPFWKRERVWREQCEKQVLTEIVEPLNQKKSSSMSSQEGPRAQPKQLHLKRSIPQ